MHLSLHLHETVRDLAPLSVLMCYVLENLYGISRDHVKSTHDTIVGIAKNATTDMAVEILTGLQSIHI